MTYTDITTSEESAKKAGRITGNRKERFLQHMEVITASKMALDRARSVHQLNFKDAQTDGFTLVSMKRAIQDRKLDTDTREANHKEEVLYRKWLEEF